MVDECLTKPCAVCGDKIHGANWYCPTCKISVCLTCGTDMKKLECPQVQERTHIGLDKIEKREG